MVWKKIQKNEIASWNNKLKSTNASFFQYPYYASGYKDIFFSAAIHLKLTDENNLPQAFCTILCIKVFIIKIGLIIRGPVIINSDINISDVITGLKNYAKENHYAFLRINPEDEIVEKILKADADFENKNYFKLYNGSQSKDFNIYKTQPESLLAGFRATCRHKIRYASEINFEFKNINSEKELKNVYRLFKETSRSKDFKIRPYKSYRSIFENGLKNNLCSVYTAEYENKIICSAFIVKDAQSYNYLSGALILKANLTSKYSPANKLHYVAMQDCFFKENKAHYNLSYSDPASGVYIFKSSFHPSVKEKPSYYTYIIKKKLSSFLFDMQNDHLKKTKSFFRSLINFIKK